MLDEVAKGRGQAFATSHSARAWQLATSSLLAVTRQTFPLLEPIRLPPLSVLIHR